MNFDFYFLFLLKNFFYVDSKSTSWPNMILTTSSSSSCSCSSPQSLASCNVAPSGLDLMISFSQPPKCWNFRLVSSSWFRFWKQYILPLSDMQCLKNQKGFQYYQTSWQLYLQYNATAVPYNCADVDHWDAGTFYFIFSPSWSGTRNWIWKKLQWPQLSGLPRCIAFRKMVGLSCFWGNHELNARKARLNRSKLSTEHKATLRATNYFIGIKCKY